MYERSASGPVFAHQQRIVLFTPSENLEHSLDLAIPTDAGVQRVLCGEPRQITAVLFQHPAWYGATVPGLRAARRLTLCNRFAEYGAADSGCAQNRPDCAVRLLRACQQQVGGLHGHSAMSGGLQLRARQELQETGRKIGFFGGIGALRPSKGPFGLDQHVHRVEPRLL